MALLKTTSFSALSLPAGRHDDSSSRLSSRISSQRAFSVHTESRLLCKRSSDFSLCRSFKASSESTNGYRLTLRRPSLEPLCYLVLGAKEFNRFSCSFERVGIRSNYMHSIAEAFEEARVYVSWRQSQVKAKVSASLDSDEGKTDGARKALEQMFQGKSNVAKKWEEEIKKRELGRDGSDGGDGGGGGRGWGGGGGLGNDDMDEDFGGQDEPWDWEEVGQTFMATFSLIILYFSITHGPKQVFRLFRLFFRWVRQGFHLRKIPDEYLEGPDTEDEEEEEGGASDEENDEWLFRRETDVSASDAQESAVQDNDSPDDRRELEAENEYLPPPPQYKKESLREKMEAQQKEKMLQMLTAKDRRGREDK